MYFMYCMYYIYYVCIVLYVLYILIYHLQNIKISFSNAIQAKFIVSLPRTITSSFCLDFRKMQTCND